MGAKNVTNEEQAEVFKGLNQQLGSVYEKMEAQNYDHSDGEEQVLSSMQPQPMMQMNDMMSQELGAPQMRSEPPARSMAKKSKAPASKFAGKQSDSLAFDIFKMSNAAQSSNYRQKKK